jgi:hypothetical protein
MSQRLADLLPLHRLEPLRRFQRCRVHQTSPLVRHTNPNPLNIVFITFRHAALADHYAPTVKFSITYRTTGMGI